MTHQSDTDAICPHCSTVQGDNPNNLLGHDDYIIVECDTCNKRFELEVVRTITYYSRTIK